MFYDGFGAGNFFQLCGDDAEIREHVGDAILYIKRSEYTSICRLFVSQ